MPPRPSNIFESNTETTATMPVVMGLRPQGRRGVLQECRSPLGHRGQLAHDRDQFHRNEPVEYRPQTLSKGLPLSTQLALARVRLEMSRRRAICRPFSPHSTP